MIGYALLALILLPLIEIALFVALGDSFGVIGTLGIVIATAVLGFYLLTQHSLRSLLRAPQEWAELLGEGDAALVSVIGAGLLAVAGILLLVPGFFTDMLGGLLLLPPMRAQVALALLKRIARVWQGARPQNPTIIEGEYKADPPPD